MGLIAESVGGLMKDPNYADPVIYQQHLDLGRSFSNQVVAYVYANGTNRSASGVLVNNRRCILISAHQTEVNGVNLDPLIDNLSIRTGINWLTSPGLTIPVVQIIRHPGRTSPGVGTDLALAILAHDVPGGIPAQIATNAPTIDMVLSLIGYGKQATPNLGNISPISGDIIGGNAPVKAIDAATFRTDFSKNWNYPLMYNANTGDSGGGVFGTNGFLYGTMSQATPPDVTGLTRSVNLSQPDKYDWIQQQTALVDSIPYVPSAKPELGLKVAGGNLNLTSSLNPTPEGGRWVLQAAPALAPNSWTDKPAVFTFSPGSGRYEFSEPVNGTQGFYRFLWRETGQ